MATVRSMASKRITVDLPPATVDALLGSPYFYAGFRAFADPEVAARYRLEPTPPLRPGDTVQWPIRPARVRRRRRRPSPSNFSAWARSEMRRQRRRPRRAHTFSVVARSPMHLELRGPRGAGGSFTIEPASSGGGSTIGIETDLPARTTRLLLAYLEAEGRDWAHFLRCGIQPLSRDPHSGWLWKHRGLVDMPWQTCDSRPDPDPSGFEALLLIRHPGHTDERAVTWEEVARANGVAISPTSMWCEIAVTNGQPPPQDPFDACDDRFGWPHDGAERLGEIDALFEVLARHTNTPEVAFGAIFETGSLAWDSYGPGPDHSVAYYSTDPDASIHPELTVVPASQICSPEVTLMRTMPVVQTKVASVPEMANLAHGRAHGVDTLWPDGQEWLLTTDVDWGYSLLGCNRRTAEAVLAAEVIEAVDLT